MPVVRRSAKVGFSARQMFDLVNDVESYPEFLGWCTGACIESATPRQMLARVDIGITGLSQSFTTRNALSPPDADTAGRIDMALVAGPFSRLEGGWRFVPLPDGGCEVCLTLDYELKLSPFSVLIARLFEEITSTQMDAFIARAAQVYRDA